MRYLIKSLFILLANYAFCDCSNILFYTPDGFIRYELIDNRTTKAFEGIHDRIGYLNRPYFSYAPKNIVYYHKYDSNGDSWIYALNLVSLKITKLFKGSYPLFITRHNSIIYYDYDPIEESFGVYMVNADDQGEIKLLLQGNYADQKSFVQLDEDVVYIPSSSNGNGRLFNLRENQIGKFNDLDSLIPVLSIDRDEGISLFKDYLEGSYLIKNIKSGAKEKISIPSTKSMPIYACCDVIFYLRINEGYREEVYDLYGYNIRSKKSECIMRKVTMFANAVFCEE